MRQSEVQLITEAGGSRKLRLVDAQPGQTLAEFLDMKGYPLNMRCGGRGLCRGCQVEFDGLLHRACQATPSDVTTAKCLRIPEASRHDHSLRGVSLFEIRAALPAPRSEGLGLACDIGTTTVAGAVWDLSSLRCLAHASRANAQARFGDNVLSRICFAEDTDDGLEQLQQALVQNSLNPLIAELCETASVTPDAIHCATAAGNPIMLHSLAGASLEGFARFPFRPEFLDQQVIPSKKLGFEAEFSLALLPSPGPFVGADIAAGALAAGLHETDAPVLFIDFGTNGEILLKHSGGWLATATAAGPAFEGGRLNCGAVVRAGVITAIEWNENAWTCDQADGKVKQACGIAGSAYIDFMALGLAHGVLNTFGRFDREHPTVRIRGEGDDQEWAIELMDGIYITEVDVAELMQAKAAIGGGVMALLEEAGLDVAGLETVFVAGGFGYHLNPAHAVAIGLLPDVPVDRIEMIGNASLGGASLCLFPEYDQFIKQFVDECRTVELNQIKTFEEYFTDALPLDTMGSFG